jgi:predicted nucleic acid-binding protein
MAILVLDTSAALAWFMPGEGTKESDSLLDRVAGEGAVVPGLWPLEVANVLQVAVRRRRITKTHRMRALAALRRLPITVDSETALHAWDNTLALADRFTLTLYDACYLELAQRSGLPLATLDLELRDAAAKLGIALLGSGK